MVYRLVDGAFAGKYVYVAENVTVSVHAGQRVKAGERIAIAHGGFPYMETGWASGDSVETQPRIDINALVTTPAGGRRSRGGTSAAFWCCSARRPDTPSPSHPASTCLSVGRGRARAPNHHSSPGRRYRCPRASRRPPPDASCTRVSSRSREARERPTRRRGVISKIYPGRDLPARIPMCRVCGSVLRGEEELD